MVGEEGMCRRFLMTRCAGRGSVGQGPPRHSASSRLLRVGCGRWASATISACRGVGAQAAPRHDAMRGRHICNWDCVICVQC